MLSRLLDIPLDAGLQWTISAIVLLSVFYTYFINKLTSSHDANDGYDHPLPILAPIPLPIPIPKRSHLALAQREQASRQSQLKVDAHKRWISQSQHPFRLLDLPPELCLLVLSYCASWPTTYVYLSRTSKPIMRLAIEACLPRIPIRLITPQHFRSFEAFARNPFVKPRLANLVRHLWVTPLKVEDVPVAVALVRRCTGIRSLATNAHVVQESIHLVTKDHHVPQLSHSSLHDLTLLTTNTSSWTTLLSAILSSSTTPTSTFFQSLRRLRLIGDYHTIPGPLSLQSLTQFSYGTTRIDGLAPGTGFAHPMSYRLGEEMLLDKDAYPLLTTAIVTKPRSVGGLRVSRAKAKHGGWKDDRNRVWLVELPADRTELELWCDSARGRGLWELCTNPSPATAT